MDRPLACLASLAVLLTPAAASAALIIGDQAQLRCAAAFAIVAGEQARGQAGAADYPPLQEKGREFFVRVMAVRMDAFGLDRAAAEAEARAKVAQLQTERAAAPDPDAFMHGVMRPCLPLLEGLPRAGE